MRREKKKAGEVKKIEEDDKMSRERKFGVSEHGLRV